MIEADLHAGDIFIWKNYPLYMDEFKSQRWLLYLGNQSLEAIVYQVSTTTQHQHYKEGGNRVHNNFFKLPAGAGGLVVDSILDLTAFFERIPESLINKCRDDLEKKGTLNQDYINRLVSHLKKDRHIPPMFKKDIYGYLRAARFVVKA
jgi:hypothetical protein